MTTTVNEPELFIFHQTREYLIVEDLKADVVKILVAEYDLLLEEAEEKVNESFANNPDIWNENAEAKDLAEFLASDDDDD